MGRVSRFILRDFMDSERDIMRHLKNWLLIGIGSISVLLGVVGIFLPVLPTTPFLLLAAACYIRSSDRLHKRLLANRWLGDYIRNYQEGRGMPRRSKIVVIALLWLSIGYSALVVVPALIGKIALFAIAVWVTYYMTCRVKTFDPTRQSGSEPEVLPANE